MLEQQFIDNIVNLASPIQIDNDVGQLFKFEEGMKITKVDFSIEDLEQDAHLEQVATFLPWPFSTICLTCICDMKHDLVGIQYGSSNCILGGASKTER
jgi:hypothetical protein